jgi:hypothetical protein
LVAGHLRSPVHSFRLRPRLCVRPGYCSLRQVRIQGACAESKPSRQNLQSKSFRLAFCLKRFSCSLYLSALRNERNIPLLGERRHCLMGFAGHSCPCITRTPFGDRNQSVALVTTKPFVRVPQTRAAGNKIGKLIKRSNPSPIRHKFARRETAVKLPGLINDHRTGCRKHIPRTVARRFRTKTPRGIPDAITGE